MMIYTSATFKPRRRSKKQKELAVKRQRKKQQFVELKTLPHRPESSTDKYKSKELSPPVSTPTPKKYEGEMAERETIAQQEIERKKMMVAPIANKMGYQYIGDMPDEVVKTLGRKI